MRLKAEIKTASLVYFISLINFFGAGLQSFFLLAVNEFEVMPNFKRSQQTSFIQALIQTYFSPSLFFLSFFNQSFARIELKTKIKERRREKGKRKQFHKQREE